MESYFNWLDLSNKAELVFQQGKHLISTNFYGATIQLYELETFFIEVYYHPINQKIMRVSIATDEDLQKHLSKIQISC